MNGLCWKQMSDSSLYWTLMTERQTPKIPPLPVLYSWLCVMAGRSGPVCDVNDRRLNHSDIITTLLKQCCHNHKQQNQGWFCTGVKCYFLIYHCTTQDFSSMKPLQTHCTTEEQPDKVRHDHWLTLFLKLEYWWDGLKSDRRGRRVSVSLGVEVNIWVWMWALIDFIRMESYLHSH